MVKPCVFAGMLLAVSVSSVASAAEVVPEKASRPPVAALMLGNFYAGIALGGRWSLTDWTTMGAGPAASVQPPLPNSATFESGTARVGGYAGYMWRVADTWAIGVESDLAWGDTNKNFPGIPGTCCGGTAIIKEGFDTSIRGRLGFLLSPAWLLYATAGVTWQALEIDAICGSTNTSCTTAHSELLSTTRSGLTIGAGLELMMQHNWLVRAEYRYADYGNIDHNFFALVPANHVAMHAFLSTQTLFAGFAYKLNGHAR